MLLDAPNIDLHVRDPEADPASTAAHGSSSDLCWDALTFTVRAKSSSGGKTGKQSKHLVHHVSGRVKGGEMLALLGPSGAGKSTFLDLLSGRKHLSSGTITLDGTTDFDMRKVSSYVEQDDALLGVLTIEETLTYAAKLSLPRSTTAAELQSRVSSTIAGLGLSHVAQNRIGTPIQRGISGGQKRRVTIGNSLVTLPRILFLDEPTSGLDSATAHEVMFAIRRLAVEHGIIVVATIHSPNWETFALFDKCMFLAQGKSIYFGPVRSVESYFGQLGFPCPQHTNPADHIMSLISTDFLHRDEADGGSGNVDAFVEAWQRSNDLDTAVITKPEMSLPSQHVASGQGTNRLLRDNFFRSMRQTWILTSRNYVNYRRNLLAYGVRAGMYIGMGVLLATVWVNLAKTSSRINDRLSVHFFSVAFLGFMSVAGIPSFLEERAVLMRERNNNLYGPGPYVLANTLVTVPFLFAVTVLFAVICYWSIGLHPGGAHFFRFLAFLFLGIYAAECQSLLVAAILPIFVAALAVAAFINGFWMCVQGYFIRAVNLPRFWYYWAHFIDYETFAFAILVKNDFRGLVFSCEGTISENNCQCAFPSSLIAQGQCAISGEDVLKNLQIDGTSMTLYAFLILIIIVVYRVLFYFAIALKKK